MERERISDMQIKTELIALIDKVYRSYKTHRSKSSDTIDRCIGSGPVGREKAGYIVNHILARLLMDLEP